MRHRWFPAALLLVAVLAASPAVAQDEDSSKGKKPIPEVTKGEKPRVERAKAFVSRLEKLRNKLRTKKKLDPELDREFETVIRQAKTLAKPITASELTDKEKADLAEELEKGKKEQDGGSSWIDRMRDRLLAKAFMDTGLSEEREKKATDIISKWYSESWSARGKGESKQVSDLKRKRDTDLRKLLGRKKANKVINNLNALSRR